MSAAELDPGPEVSRWQEFPEIPVCDGGILEGFEEFMDFTPHASAESFAAHGFAPSLSEPEFRAGAEAAEAHPGPVSSARRTVAESRQFKNRMSQARFRRKKKEHTESLERELARTAAQLSELQSMQTAINAKNQLLVKLLQLNEQAELKLPVELPETTATVQDLYKQRGFHTVQDPVFAACQQVPALRLTIGETGEQFLPVQQVGQLGLQQFSKIYTAYIHQMAACLAKLTQEGLSDANQHSAMQRVRELVIECSSLLVITLMSNPSLYKDLQHCKIDEGIVCPDTHPLTYYSNVLDAMQYTDHQLEDLLNLRLLFCHRTGQLARERTRLLDSVACKMDGSSHVCDRLNNMAMWSDLLRENGAEEHRSYMQILTASCRGVSTCKQLATGFVCAFPWLLRMSQLIRAETVRRGLPSMQDIMADTNVTDEQHAANWAQIPQYLGRLTEHDLDAHVPFWTRHMGCVGSAVP